MILIDTLAQGLLLGGLYGRGDGFAHNLILNFAHEPSR